MMGRVVLAGLMAHRMTPDARSASDRAIIDQILTWPLPASPEENDAGPGTATSSG